MCLTSHSSPPQFLFKDLGGPDRKRLSPCSCSCPSVHGNLIPYPNVCSPRSDEDRMKHSTHHFHLILGRFVTHMVIVSQDHNSLSLHLLRATWFLEFHDLVCTVRELLSSGYGPFCALGTFGCKC